MKILLALSVLLLMGCASLGELYERGEYKETVCTKKFFKKKVCEVVEKEGLHVVKKIKVKGAASKFSFKDGEESGEGSSMWPNLSGLQLKAQN